MSEREKRLGEQAANEYAEYIACIERMLKDGILDSDDDHGDVMTMMSLLTVLRTDKSLEGLARLRSELDDAWMQAEVEKLEVSSALHREAELEAKLTAADKREGEQAAEVERLQFDRATLVSKLEGAERTIASQLRTIVDGRKVRDTEFEALRTALTEARGKLESVQGELERVTAERDKHSNSCRAVAKVINGGGWAVPGELANCVEQALAAEREAHAKTKACLSDTTELFARSTGEAREALSSERRMRVAMYEALREQCSYSVWRGDVAIAHGCRLCRCEWDAGTPEKHASGCPAACGDGGENGS